MPVLYPLGGGADDTVRLNVALHLLDDVVLGAGTFILSDMLTLNRAVRLRAETAGAAVLRRATLGTGKRLAEITANDVVLSGIVFEGPLAGVYVANEDLVRIVGTSAAAPLERTTIDRCTFRNVGSAGLKGTFADHVSVTNCTFAGCGYAGAMFLSCMHGVFNDNTIGTVGPGTQNNGYGVSFTHDSTGWPGTRATQPFCDDWTVERNAVDGVEWEGIDSHGGSRIVVRRNTVTNCGIGIAVASSSGAASDYAGEHNHISDNVVDGGTRANTSAGIIIDGGSVEQQRNTKVTGNRITRHGVPSHQYSGAILASHCVDCVVDGNIVDEWGTSVVYTSGVMTNMVIRNNRIGTIADDADSFGYALYSDALSGLHTFANNNVDVDAAIPPRRGVQAAQLATRPVFGYNELYRSTEAAYVLFDNSWVPT